MRLAQDSASETVRALRVRQVLLWVTPRGEGIQAYLRSVLQAFGDAPDVEFSAAALHPGVAPAQFGDRVHLGVAQAGWRNALRLARHLARSVGEVDVVHVHGALHWPLLFVALACSWRRVPWVVSPHGSLTSWFLRDGRRRRRWFARWIALPLMRRASAVIATTPWEADQIRAVLPQANIVVVPPAVTGAEGAPPGDAPPLRIVFVGQFNRAKGLSTLLDAVAQLPEARLELVGRATEQGFGEALLAQARALRIERRVAFAGYLSGAAKQAALCGAHVFALPSLGENFSFATAEALCLGVPVVVSTEVALASVVERYGCGSVVPVGDPAALADALRPYADPAFRGQRSLRATLCAREQFAPQLMYERLLGVYVAASRSTNRKAIAS